MYLSAPRVSAAAEESVAVELEREETDPYATHPPLRERLEALRAFLPTAEVASANDRSASDDPPAITLLDEIQAMEGEMLLGLAVQPPPEPLKPVAWEEVGAQVVVPLWRRIAGAEAEALEGITVETLPDVARSVGSVTDRMVDRGDPGEPMEAKQLRARILLEIALGAALAGRGWSAVSLPGESVILRGPRGDIVPFETVKALATEEMDAGAWAARCAALGIEGLTLAPADA